MLIKEIQNNLNKMEIYHIHGAENSTSSPKTTFRFKVIPIKIPADFWDIANIDKTTLKFIWKAKRIKIARTI